MSAGAIRAGRAFVEIFAADSAFQQSMTRIRTSMATMGQQLRRAGTGSFFAGAALGAPLMLAVRSAANFENALFDARASAGLTAAEVDKIRVKSLELSKAGLGGPAAIAQAFTALVKAGMPLEEAMGGAAEAVIKFAANAGVDVTTAAETASDAMNVFGVSSTQATDILKAAADSSSTSVQAMVQAFSQSSAVAGMANQSMQTLAASLAIMANNGVKGSDAGTSVKTMLLRLTAPSDEAATKLREVGLSADSFRGADGKMLPLANVLDILNASLAGLTEGQRDQALLKIFGTDAIRAGTILLRAGSAGLQGMTQAMAASGTNADAYKTKMSGIAGAMQTVTSATERLQITVAAALGPALQSASQSVAGFMDYLGRLATDFPGLVTTAAGLAVGLLGIGTAGIVLGNSLQGLTVIIGLTQKALALMAANPAVVAGLAVAAVAVAGIGLALRQIWPDFKTTTDGWLEMVGIMKANPPPGQREFISDADVKKALVFPDSQNRLAQIQQEAVATNGASDSTTQLRDLAKSEIERIKGMTKRGRNADGSLSAPVAMTSAEKAAALGLAGPAELDQKVQNLLSIAGNLEQQIAKRSAPAAAEAAAAAGVAGAKPAGPTEDQQKEAARIREQMRTPQEKLNDERNKLLGLLNAQALDEPTFLKAVAAAEAEAMNEISAANDKAAGKFKEVADRVKAIGDEVATPEEKLAARIAELRSLPLDAETFARAMEAAKADAASAMQGKPGEQKQIVSAGTFGDAAMLAIGPNLVDPAQQTAENTRQMVDQLAALAMAGNPSPPAGLAPAAPAGEPVMMVPGAAAPADMPAAIPAVPPTPPLGLAAEAIAPRVPQARQAVDLGADMALQTATLSAAFSGVGARIVEAVDRTTDAIKSTVAVLEKIAENTTDLGGAFL